MRISCGITFFVASAASSSSAFSPPAAVFVGRSASATTSTSSLKMSSTQEKTATKTGKVAWFNAGRGFGFISMDDGSDDVYVHQSNILMDGYRKLEDGDRVDFKVGTDTSGRKSGKPYAFDVTVLESAATSSGSPVETDTSAVEAPQAEPVEPKSEAAPEVATEESTIDVSIPYDAAAQLAYESSEKVMEYGAFKAMFEEDAVAKVVAKKVARKELAAAKEASAAKQAADEAAAQAEAMRVKEEEEKIAAAAEEKRASEEKEAAEAAAAEAEAESKRLEETLAKEPTKDYSSMDVEERAFNILLDLGMITLSPDPDSADYDSSKDDDFAPENANI